jgi:surfactin synthase thioesterase subunit
MIAVGSRFMRGYLFYQPLPHNLAHLVGDQTEGMIRAFIKKQPFGFVGQSIGML